MMGNCFSSSNTASLHELVDRPGIPQEQSMSADIIRQGLNSVAATLNSKRQNITIIAVGGAVNTLLLNTRALTSDVDFFYRTKTKHEDVTKVIAAADAAAKKLKLGDQWLNNHTAVFVDEDTIQRLYDEAITQGEVVFNAPGLTIYAAPWRYALGTKLDRLAKPGARLHDMSDAVGYLEQLIAKRGGRPVKKSEIKAWSKEFEFTVPTDKLMVDLGVGYEQKTGKHGVING